MMVQDRGLSSQGSECKVWTDGFRGKVKLSDFQLRPPVRREDRARL